MIGSISVPNFANSAPALSASTTAQPTNAKRAFKGACVSEGSGVPHN